MKFSKFLILSIVLLASVIFSSFAYAISPSQPLDIQLSKQLRDIRDSIIEQSFKQLPVGAWAKYMTKNTDGSITYTKVAYLGKGIHEDEDLYVGKPLQEGGTTQIWYRIKETDKFLGGKKRIYYFDTETQEAYLLQSDWKIL